VASALETREEDEIFAADSYKLNVPAIDGHRATKLAIRFSGAGDLDRTSEDDLALLEAMRIGAPVRLIITGVISGKGYSLARKPGDEDELSYTCTVRVESVEAGEIA
jgi:hypothetical protein